MDPPECSGHSHDHDHGDDLGTSLRPYINFPGVFCLNEEIAGSGRSVLKLHEERLSAAPSVLSPDDDPELLLFVPFTEAVTILSITVRNASTNRQTVSPRRIKLFTDRDSIDFDSARELPFQQQLELLPPEHFADGTIDYPCRPAGRFQNVSSIAIFFMDNYDDSGESATEITHVGLKGRGTSMKRVAVSAVYETRGMLKDHKVDNDKYGTSNVL